MSVLSATQAQLCRFILAGFCPLLYAQDSIPSASQPAEHKQDAAAATQSWGGFRGLGHSGFSSARNVPDSFDLSTNRNLRWKYQFPKEGISSPILFNDCVVLTGSDGKTDEVYGIDAETGKERWKLSLPATQEVTLPSVNSGFAASTPVTDGENIYAVFVSGNLVAVNSAGKTVWSKNLGALGTQYGYASSPILAGKNIVLQLDVGDAAQSCLLALDRATGKEVWKKPRPVENSWTTPTLARSGDREIIVTAAKPHAIAYDAQNGTELWKTEGLGDDVTPSPICAGGFAFVVQANQTLSAIQLNGKGEVKPAWVFEGSMPSICSPVSDETQVIIVTDTGVLQGFEVSTGKKLWERDLDMSFYSSPSLIGKNLYLFSHDETSTMVVVPAGKSDQAPLKSALGEPCLSSPAVADGRLYIRGSKTLFCIGTAK